MTDIKWDFPSEGEIALNCDGAVTDGGNKSACGGVIWDSNGAFICGFGANLGVCLVLTAELKAIYLGLKLAGQEAFARSEWIHARC